MKRLLSSLAFLGIFVAHLPLLHAGDKKEAESDGPLSFVVKSIDGKELDLSKFKGKVVLIVNTASQCGFTPQYDGLQRLYKQNQEDGFVVLGVPSNSFNQEPGTNAEITKFCQAEYEITFPMTEKMNITGKDKCPLYKYLTEKKTNGKFSGEVSWNFEKFLIGRDGKVIGRFSTKVTPGDDEIMDAVQKALKEKVK